MREKVKYLFQAFWKWMRKTLVDKCGEFPFREFKPVNNHSVEVIEREIVINKTKIHVKSIFTGKTSLDSAMKNIVARKISDSESYQ